MKFILSNIFILLLSLISFSQSPETINYQSVVRDGNNQILTNQNVGLQFVIRQGTSTGTAVYTETFDITSNNFGLINLKIGTGTTQGSLSNVNWANGSYFLETSIDITGGTSYVLLGASEFVSVPYVFHAKIAESVINDAVDDADSNPTNELNTGANLSGNTLNITDGGGTQSVDLSPLQDGTGTDDQILTISGMDLSIENGNTVTLPSSNLWNQNGSNVHYSGNVGIGTNSPNNALEVDGDIGIADFIYHNGDNDTYFGFSSNDNYDVWIGNNNVIDANATTVSVPVTNVKMENLPATTLAIGDRVLASNSTGFLKTIDLGTVIEDEVIEITNSNHSTVSTSANQIIRITEEITLSGPYSKLDYSGLHVSGGKITGTGSQIIYLDNNTVFEGVVFENVRLRGSSTTHFTSCTFINVSEAGFESVFESCLFNNCTFTSVYKIGSLQGCEVNNCLIPRVNAISDCEIDNTTLGDASGNDVGRITNSFLSDSKIYLSNSFTGNHCENTNLVIRSGNYGVTAVGNTFDGRLSGEDNIIHLDISNSGTTVINVNDNVFTATSSLPQSIKVTGSSFPNSHAGLVGISGNTFTRGVRAILHSSNIRTTINNNAVFVTNLGVGQNLPSLVVRDNDIF